VSAASHVSPAGHKETVSRQSAFDLERIDEGVMPATRPEAISNRVRLANEAAAAMRSLVAERGARNTFLRSAGPVIDAGVAEAAPDEKSIAGGGAQNDFFTWAGEESPLAAVAESVC
jgi:hypothetical protein